MLYKFSLYVMLMNRYFNYLTVLLKPYKIYFFINFDDYLRNHGTKNKRTHYHKRDVTAN